MMCPENNRVEIFVCYNPIHIWVSSTSILHPHCFMKSILPLGGHTHKRHIGIIEWCYSNKRRCTTVRLRLSYWSDKNISIYNYIQILQHMFVCVRSSTILWKPLKWWRLDLYHWDFQIIHCLLLEGFQCLIKSSEIKLMSSL